MVSPGKKQGIKITVKKPKPSPSIERLGSILQEYIFLKKILKIYFFLSPPKILTDQ